MATHYSSGQYEDAYAARNSQNWSRPRVFKQHPSAREGYSQFIANDRGHLLPLVPRSKASPWGTYMSTWDMPLRIPPAKVSLTSRSVAAADHLTEWINKSKALGDACNGLIPEITGKPSEPKETSVKAVRPTRKGEQRPDSAAKMPAQGEIKYRGAAIPEGPLSRQPGCIDVRLKEDSSQDIEDAKEVKRRSASEIPLSRQPGSMDVRLKDTTPTPKAPALSRPSSREPTPRRATSAETPPSSRPRSLDGKPKGVSTPELLVACRPGSMEANHKNGPLPETTASSRPTTKASCASAVQKAPTEVDEDPRESPQREGPARPPTCLAPSC
ncbi:protein Flattop [Eublepharis macularius]|uniref:Protein Flattop n=1 Tax=Eublepharis macularius TaxID=481883 RepID=A0AA97LCG3_EUBMA|nr:protein Flattop [Eublepharis macularius]